MHNRTIPIALNSLPLSMRIRELPAKVNHELARAYYTYAKRHRSADPLHIAIDHTRKAAQRAANLARGIGRDDLATRYVGFAHELLVQPPSDRAVLVPKITALAQFAGAFEYRGNSMLSLYGFGNSSDSIWPELQSTASTTQATIELRPIKDAPANLAADLRKLAERVVHPGVAYTAWEWRLYGFARQPDGWRPYDRGYTSWRWHEAALTDSDFEPVYAPLRAVLLAEGVDEINVGGRNLHGISGAEYPHCTVMPQLGHYANKARVVGAVARLAKETAALLESRELLS